MGQDNSKNLQLKQALLAFHHFHGGHNGYAMAKTVLHLLSCASIIAQVYFIVQLLPNIGGLMKV